MAAPHQILLYGRERGEAFLERARAHALANHPGLQIVQRHPAYFGCDGCEATAAIVYVESYFAGVVADYRAARVPVYTEHEIGVADEVEHHGQEAAQAGSPELLQDGQDAQGQGAVGQVVPIARRRGRPRKVA